MPLVLNRRQPICNYIQCACKDKENTLGIMKMQQPEVVLN